MWHDKILYWAWLAPIPLEGLPPTPTKKRIHRARVGNYFPHDLAIGVWDDSKYTPLYRGDSLGELGWYHKLGCRIELLGWHYKLDDRTKLLELTEKEIEL